MSADAPVKDQDKFVLRLPDGMRDRLKAEAEANKRSMNAEIVARLQATLDIQGEKAYQDGSLLEELKQTRERMERMEEFYKKQMDEQIKKIEEAVQNLMSDSAQRGTKSGPRGRV